MKIMSLPFIHLNLKWNPFGEVNLIDRKELVVAEVDHLIDLLREPKNAIQFIDDKGRGKTSHILAVHRHFEDSPYTHIGEGENPVIPPGQPLFIDELQRIPWLKRRNIFKRKVSFVIGTHIDYTSEMKKAGIQVHTIYPGKTVSRERLEQIFNNRIEWARRAPGPVPRIPGNTLEDLINTYGDDIRSMEGHLYSIFQQLEEICDVKM